MIQYKSVVLFCNDVRKACEFYQKLFDLSIELDLGEMVSFTGGISLWDQAMASDHAYAGAPPSPSPRPSQEVYFETDDMDGFDTKLRNGSIKPLHPVQTAPWQQRVIRFFDPDGHLIEVGESMEEVVRRLNREGRNQEEIVKITMMPEEFISIALQNK